jgi:hypothetical protein
MVDKSLRRRFDSSQIGNLLKKLLILFALLCPSLAQAQTVTLPDKISGAAGSFIEIPATTDCASLQWLVLDPGLNLFPVSLLKDSKTAVVTGPAGTYRLLAYGAKADVPTKPAVCTVIIGGGSPTPIVNPPDPTPIVNPPDPKPPVDGQLFVVVVFDSTKLTEPSRRMMMQDQAYWDSLAAKGIKYNHPDISTAAGATAAQKFAPLTAKYGVPTLVILKGNTVVDARSLPYLKSDVDAAIAAVGKKGR